jgi:hypothetical protein
MESGNQAYSLLLIFTNGRVHSVEKTVAALDEVHGEPLSIVIIGVGPADFDNDMQFLDDRRQSKHKRDNVKFVDMKAHKRDEDGLTEATLKEIPKQLVDYFVSKGIHPNAPVDADEIVIEPFNEEEDIQAEVVADFGDVSLGTDVKKPNSAVKPEDQGMAGKLFGDKAKQEILKQGKKIMQRHKKTFGRVGQKFQKQLMKKIIPKF